MGLSEKRQIEVEVRREQLVADGLVYPSLSRHIESEDLQWFEDTSVHDLCCKLVAKFARFEHINMDNVIVLRSLVKQSGSRQAIASCGAIRYPSRAFNPDRKYLYSLVVHDDLYEDLEYPAKLLVLYHELCHIPRDFTGQSVVQHDVEDFRTMLDALGTAWTLTPPEALPDLLRDTNIHKLYGLAFRGREE